MHWNSFSEFIHMGGYGLYVWGSYGVALLVMLIEPVLVRQRLHRAILQVQETHEGNEA